MHPVALTASFLLFSLSMVGCKKSSSDPAPSNPPVTTLTCRPLQQTSYPDGKRIHAYDYDDQGRIKTFTKIYSGSSSGQERTSFVSYYADSIVVTDGSGIRLAYTIANGRIRQFVNHAFDNRESYYYNSAGRLDSLVATDVFSRVVTHIDYNAEGLPIRQTKINVTTSGRDTSEVDTYTYDMSRTVAFVPYSDFSIAPGLDKIRINRPITSINSEIPGQGVSTTTLDALAYDSKGNITRLQVKAPGYFAVTYDFTYDCK